MQPVYIQRIASIHPQGNHSQENNPKVNDSPDVSANRPFLQACEPDYKDIIANATLRRRMSRIRYFLLFSKKKRKWTKCLLY